MDVSLWHHKHYDQLCVVSAKHLNRETIDDIRREHDVPNCASERQFSPSKDEHGLKIMWPTWTEQQVKKRLPNGTVILTDGTVHLENLPNGR